jgi:hypothetical protein
LYVNGVQTLLFQYTGEVGEEMTKQEEEKNEKWGEKNPQ